MFARLANRPRQPTEDSKGFDFMATQSKTSSKSKTQAKRATTEAKKSAGQPRARRNGRHQDRRRREEPGPGRRRVRRRPPGRRRPLVSDRVADLVEPWTGRTNAEKQIKAYRRSAQMLKRTERRGTSARRKATTEARKTRNRVEREARKHQRTVETTLEAQPHRGRAARPSSRASTSRPAALRISSSSSAEQFSRACASHRAGPRGQRLLVRSVSAASPRPAARRRARTASRLCRDEGAEQEADAAAVVVAERVGVAEAAAGVGLDGAELGPGHAREAELELDRQAVGRDRRFAGGRCGR